MVLLEVLPAELVERDLCCYDRQAGDNQNLLKGFLHDQALLVEGFHNILNLFLYL